ncbi:type Z 30S ribosomal protein S14 [Athalassotoga saccharophila]|uniref:type Z 30S ribosomal protein S14 n=1 Tax=Athalassotoga saccharophila TaxID=1441386 RepID=UPI0013796DAD|nr:type Z 30S ribosomal protein S14 [Athalassotoga saccharophila]BBJ27219.1 30S ribosomal protein S14 type Z [Athalassotoga saccharophila]
MARKALINKANAKPKYKTRQYTRCKICGRPHSVSRELGICRLCFRKLALEGKLPGIKKASW